MKKLLFSLLSLIVGFFFLSSSASSKTLKIGTGEYTPFLGKNIYKQGFVNHIVAEVFEKAGYKVKFKYFPWARSYVETKRGKVDISTYWYANEQRKKENFLSDPVTSEELVFFYSKTNPMKSWKNLRDLKGLRIGVTRGYTYTKEFWDLGKKGIFKLDVTKADINNFKKLIRGRIDIFPAGKVPGLEIIRKTFAPGIADSIDFNSKPLTAVNGYVLFPKVLKDSKKLQGIFNKGLAKMKKNGTYEKYYNDLITGTYSK